MTTTTPRTDAEKVTCINQALSWLESGIDEATTVRLLRNKFKMSRATAYRDVKQARENMMLPRFSNGGLEARDRLLQNIRFTLAQITLQIQEAEEVNPQLVQLQLKLVKEEKNLLLMGAMGLGTTHPSPNPLRRRSSLHTTNTHPADHVRLPSACPL